ncbi:MAG: InlB B-repeat-containing protein, partial [Clostridiales bacterium]|nr:InlB B-repeat-containing protein [Clostridiales bacterium]
MKGVSWVREKGKVVFFTVVFVTVLIALASCTPPAKKYTVTFDGCGGSTTADVKYISDGAIIDEPDEPVYRGHRFDGWYKDAEYAEKWNFESDKVTGNRTLYAKWNANTYTITYNYLGADGDNTEISKSVTYGSEYTLVVPTKTGFVFYGWYSSSNGIEKKFTNQNGISLEPWREVSDMTLYADWESVVYTVTLDAQGGGGGTESVLAAYGSAMPVAVAPEKTGHTFGGYYTGENGSGVQYYTSYMAGVRNWDIAGAVVLFAKWTPKTYVITYDYQCADIGDAESTQTVTYGSGYTLFVPTRTGYVFGGWYANTNGNGTRYTNEYGTSLTNWTGTSDRTLYAKWTANTYTVTLDAQGGSGGATSVTVKYDSAMPAASAPVKAGYAFGGYYTDRDGGGTQYYTNLMESARDFDLTENITLYARWMSTIYDVSFDSRGGEGGTASVSATYGEAMPAATAPTKTGYTFGGYYTGENGSGTMYYTDTMESARDWDILNATILYAKWTENTYVVTYEYSSADGGNTELEKTVTYGSAYTLTVPTKTGYTFGGWYASANGSGTRYTDEYGASLSVWTETSGRILYAKWTVNEYIVTYEYSDADGGNTEFTKTVTYGSDYTLAVPTKTGYTFGGWYASANGSGTRYTDEYGASLS